MCQLVWFIHCLVHLYFIFVCVKWFDSFIGWFIYTLSLCVSGGLDEALNNILNMCQDQSVPFVFALGRRALGRACAKFVPVSVAGIFNYDGCEVSNEKG